MKLRKNRNSSEMWGAWRTTKARPALQWAGNSRSSHCVLYKVFKTAHRAISRLGAAVSIKCRDCWSLWDGHVHQARRRFLVPTWCLQKHSGCRGGSGGPAPTHPPLLDPRSTQSLGEEPAALHAKDRLSWDAQLSSAHALFSQIAEKGWLRYETVGYPELGLFKTRKRSRGHFGPCRRWKIITTSNLYTLFQGINTSF